MEIDFDLSESVNNHPVEECESVPLMWCDMIMWILISV